MRRSFYTIPYHHPKLYFGIYDCIHAKLKLYVDEITKNRVCMLLQQLKFPLRESSILGRAELLLKIHLM